MGVYVVAVGDVVEESGSGCCGEGVSVVDRERAVDVDVDGEFGDPPWPSQRTLVGDSTDSWRLAGIVADLLDDASSASPCAD